MINSQFEVTCEVIEIHYSYLGHGMHWPKKKKKCINWEKERKKVNYAHLFVCTTASFYLAGPEFSV